MRRGFSFRVVAVAAVIVMAIAACGGGADEGNGDGGAGATTTTQGSGGSGGSGETGTEADLEQAATDLFTAFLSADDQAYFDGLSRECRETYQYAAVQAHVSGRRFNAQTGGGIDLSAVTVESVSIDSFTGDSASVSIATGGTSAQFQENLPTYWIYEEGAWRMDDCGDFTEAQGGLEGYGLDRNDPIPLGGVADVNGWLVGVTYIQPDDEEFIVSLGGQPAASGHQLFTAQTLITYNGAEAAVTIGDNLAFAMVHGDTVYGDEASCDVAGSGAEIDPTESLGPGDDASGGILCREVASSDVDGLLLRVTHVPTGAEYWWDLSEG